MISGTGGTSGQRSSQHPIDQLIREVLQSGRHPTDEEIQAMLERIGTAPFNRRDIAVDPDLVGREYLGQVIPVRAEARLAHLWKRVLVDEQWAVGTTVDEYLGDLRSAIFGGSVQVMIAVIRESPSAGVLAPNRMASSRRAANTGPLLFVGYSVNGGMITTGYQRFDRNHIRLPGNARWLN